MSDDGYLVAGIGCSVGGALEAIAEWMYVANTSIFHSSYLLSSSF
jgi:hypothetical protein